MGDEKQASVTPEAEAAKGDQSATTQTPPKTEADAERKQPEVTDEQKKANDKLAERGRELKAEKERTARLEAELESAKVEREKLWFTHQDTSESDRDAFRKSREQEAKEAPKLAKLEAKAALADAIADEENPVVRKTLRALRVKAEASGQYPSAATIAAIRESLAPEEEESQQQEETPPNVTASRGTRGAAGPSIADQIKTVETSIKAHDGKYNYGDLLVLRQQSQMEEAAARKG